MWQRIKEYIKEWCIQSAKEEAEMKIVKDDIIIAEEFLNYAKRRYCATCDTFFKNNAGAAAHKVIKHKI